MNYLAIDFGTKRIGLAYTINDIIFTLPMAKNDDNFFKNLSQIITDYHLEKIYVGISEGKIADMTKNFVLKLSSMLNLPIETVEEAVSTIEAEAIFKTNKKASKSYSQQIDSIAAAVILRRVINS
ncbi:MAG: Holliday junction resolvase RuvX [Candidatus Shapirobacteria bacterium]|jgi:putative transcription antitermination factor YqgF